MASCFAEAEIELGAPFGDHMVLQRGMAVPIWGWAEPGNEVTVFFAGQTQSATADASGKWMAKLDQLEASTQPRAMTIKSGDHTRQLSDVLVGEVWMASGQSNMQWPASKTDVGRVLQKAIAERVEAGEEQAPMIREMKVSDVYSALHPIERASGVWSKEQDQFSAIAFAFAYELHRELGVPIGVLNCSFSTTAIEAWTPRWGFAGNGSAWAKDMHRRILETDPASPEHRLAWSEYYAQVDSAIAMNKLRVSEGKAAKPIDVALPGNLRGNRDASWMYNARVHPVVPFAIRGAIWNQGYASMNIGRNYEHGLSCLIQGWRASWGRDDLPVYFNQFYSHGVDENNHPTLGNAADMRQATVEAARKIPNVGMASQIDIGGSVHYYNKAQSGKRLALHALKHQYDKDIVVNGPIVRGYTVQGSTLTVLFDHAEGGLIVAETKTNQKLTAQPTVVPEGIGAVSLFYLVDAEGVWHKANAKIVGEAVELTAPGVEKPMGVSYGSGGIAFQPNVYNRAMLPMSPFTLFNDQYVWADTWADNPPKVAGYEPAPGAGGIVYEYRKMPILSTQFRDNAVLQHGQPVTIWGSAVHDWGYEAEGEAEIRFSFDGHQKTIPVTPGMKEWSVTLAAMKPSAEPKTLRAALYIDGALVHERVAEGIVVGDVWFVAAPSTRASLPTVEPGGPIARVMRRKAKRDAFPRPSRFSVAVSTTPKNRFASEWLDAGNDLGGVIARRLADQAGHPVGVVFMQNNAAKDAPNPPLKSWLPFQALSESPTLAEDYAKLGTLYPGSPSYDANVRRYVGDWKAYWSDYVPAMIKTKRVPDGAAWGVYPSLATADNASQATLNYNVMVHSFTPAALKGLLFITSPTMTAGAGAPAFAEQLPVLANAWKDGFGGNPPFYFTAPDRETGEAVMRARAIQPPAGWVGMQYQAADDLSQTPSLERKQINALIDGLIDLAYGS